jgi:cellulose biosynthesis protein BcsQ
MENGNTQDVNDPASHKELANDVALLYSWARIENTPYRDFSRQRTSPSRPAHSEETSNEAQGGTSSSHPGTNPLSPNHTSATVDVFDQAVPGVLNPPPPGHAGHSAISERKYNTDILPEQYGWATQDGLPEPSGKPPALAVYSIAGGVGKTTLCANLGKTLCSLGEQLLLVDATGRGILPFYFGATELRTGVRKFIASGAGAPPIQVIAGGEITQQWLDRDVQDLMATTQRTIFDLSLASLSLLPVILKMCTLVLVPLLPDLNSIVSLAHVEDSLQAMGPNEPTVCYFFNRFDEQSTNDQRARDFVSRHCGHRLLPISLRNDLELTNVLQSGLPGVDNPPGSGLSHDYLQLALWVRRVAPLNSSALLPARWSEQ